MTNKDQNNKNPKNRYNLRSSDSKTSKRNKKNETIDNNKKLKKNKESDSDDSGNDGDSYSIGSDSDEEMDMVEYRKMLNKIFPSKYMKNKVKNTQELTNKDKNKKNISKKDTTTKKTGKKSKQVEVIESSEEYEEDDDDESEYETVDEDESSDEETSVRNKMSKKGFNIIFTIGDKYNLDNDEDEDEDEDYDESETEDESEEEDDSENEYSESDSDCEENGNKSNKPNMLDDECEKMKSIETIQTMRKTLEGILEKDTNNKFIKNELKEMDAKEKQLKKEMEKKTRKEKTKNVKKFKDLINKKNVMNDFKFFKDKLSIDQQSKIITEIEEVNKINIVQKPYRLTLLESSIPIHLKSIALNKIASLRYMEPGNGEYYKIKNWVDTFMQIPFNIYRSLPLHIDDGIDKCHDFMASSKVILDEAVYGLNDAKMQIMQMVGQWISNPSAIGTAIAIKGPMGTGKTTLVKEGISKILGRDFAFLALGGATDSSVLEGHGYTYEGSTWGKIVDILIKSKSMNPVIYFDELDKISDTPKGEEIAGILTHLTDTTQNSQFHDKYFSEIDFDLSKCLFIFSYNDESKVNPILLDRMYKIQTKGYEKKDKIVISNNYLIPTIIQQVNFKKDDIIIPNETIEYLIEEYTLGEKGVRNLKRCLEIIYTKLNLYRLMKPETKLFEDEMSLTVQFPYTVTKDIVKKIIKTDDGDKSYLFRTMYI